MRPLALLRRRWWLLVALLVMLVVLFGSRVATFLTDIAWYSSVGFLPVFSTVLLTQIGLALVAGLVMTALIAGNLLLARRLAPNFRIPSAREENVERYRDLLDPFATGAIVVVALVIGLLSGLAATGEWPRYLLWANGGDFGRTDPQFGIDLGFFVFRLPFWSYLNSWLFGSLALTIILTLVAHYIFGGIRPQSPGQKFSPQATVHLSLLLGVLVAVRAWGFWLDRYLLSYSTRGVITGLSYTDVNAQLPAYQLLTAIAAACVLLFLANIRFRNFLLPATGVAILVIAAVALSGIFPAVVQRVQVEPQEFQREREYIARNQELTRFGFGIDLEDDVTFADFPAEGEIDEDTAQENSATLEAIRLWDPDVLSAVYRQLQGLRQYFEFPDVDVDRYQLDGRQQQLNLSVRELDDTEIPDPTWQNRHLIYTHGYGVVASDPNDSAGRGDPRFLLQDIPPQGVEELALEQPRVYFGQRGPEYSVVNTDEEEFDYAAEERQEDAQAYVYEGADGVSLGGLVNRLGFALRYGEANLLLSGLLNQDSRILIHRNVVERVEAVAPFLQLDGDPYPVIVDGRVQWILDAYTTSAMLPYSTRQQLEELTQVERTVPITQIGPDGTPEVQTTRQSIGNLQGVANYIRNSVKVVVDAYDGTINLYVTDPDDPVVQAWRSAFPGSFTDVDEASEELRAHFRYPEDLLRVQSEVFTRYHIPEEQGFYNQNDAWAIPPDAAAVNNLPTNQRPAEGQEPRLRPYYLQMRLPGESDDEFALVQPFNPRNRPNLIAWLAARSDPENYGDLRVYRMPADRNIQGTAQVQASINQNPGLAEQITLLGQRGSQILYGNLLIIPVGDALLYAQPLFVQAEQTQIPQLAFAVLVLGDRVVFGSTLPEALTTLLGEGAPETEGDDTGEPEEPEEPGEPGDEGDQTVPPEVADLITQALEAFAEADQALAEGDLGGYQESTARAGELLTEAQNLLGGPIPEVPATP
jgi:uncharacterized membrane protein (UPF0182 family)